MSERNLQDIIEQEEKLKIEKALALRNALSSNNVNDIYRASSYIKALEQRDDQGGKSMLIDPQLISSSPGYMEKPFTLSYSILRGMAKTHIIKAIRTTRREQVSNFLSPQKDKYSTGFIVTKKDKYTLNKEEVKLSKAEESVIEGIIEFILECGTTNNYWHADTFSTFVDKIIDDSLTIDQACAEIRRNRKGEIIEFFHVDGATMRVADTYWGPKSQQDLEKEIQGYCPSYVQLYQGRVVNEYYPWEMMFGLRNPSTSIESNGYGKSELEDMIETVTAILNSSHYNANFFKVGSAPKGILRYSGNINQNTVEDFKRQWMAQLAGVDNMHKMAIINADKMDFINTTMSNKDMEFGKFQDFLIKVACALYSIDPAEIGFPMQGSSDGGGALFEGSNEKRLQWSRDKGLKPLLKSLEEWLNKYIVSQLNPDYILRFVGIDDEIDAQQELDGDIKALGAFMTPNEIRAKRNLPPLPDGDIILNPVYMQGKSLSIQGNEQSNQALEDEDNPFKEALEKSLDQIFA